MITQLMYIGAAVLALLLFYLLVDILVRARVKSLMTVLSRHERTLSRVRSDRIRLEHRIDKLEKIRRIK